MVRERRVGAPGLQVGFVVWGLGIGDASSSAS